MSAKRLTRLALFTAAALILYIVELQLPGPVPIPGVKLGLANIFTVMAVYCLTPEETILMVTVKVLLGTLFSGNFSALFFSFSGAVFCLCGMLLLKRIIAPDDIWLCSVLGAMLHNLGQIAAAAVIMGSLGVLAYLPILLVTGAISGLFTGLCAKGVVRRLPKIS